MKNTVKNSGRIGLLGKISAAAGIFIAAVLVMAGAGAVETYAEDWYVAGGIQWSVDDGTLTIKAAAAGDVESSYTAGQMPNYTVSPNVAEDGMPPWGFFWSNVSKIVIADDVSNIGNYAFAGMTGEDIKQFDSIVIGKGVSDIGAHAFSNTIIDSLTDYAIGLNKSNIDATAFLSGDTSSNYEVGVIEAECYADNGIYALFSGYNTAATKVTIDSEEYTVNKADIKIDLITVNVIDYNLFETAGKMYVTWSGAASEVEAANNTTDSVSSYVLRTFFAQSSDASKWKIFAISKSDTAAPVDAATLKVPTPSAWKNDYNNIKVYEYNETTATTAASVSEITASVTKASDYITFPVSRMGTYALYLEDTTTVTTTATATTAATTTTAVTTTAATTKAATTSATNINGGSGYNGSGKLDSTPGTGVKDFLWIIIPVAVMLLGVGIVILGRRKQKNID